MQSRGKHQRREGGKADRRTEENRPARSVAEIALRPEEAQRKRDVRRVSAARSAERQRAPVENTLRQSAAHRRLPPEAIAGAAESAATDARSPGSDKNGRPSSETPARPNPAPVPEEVRQRFVQVGRKYFFPDGARAFTDRGSRLTTPSENAEVIRSLVAIAQARGWGNVTVSGTERFRREAWFAAQQSGLAVRGYRPTEFEQERLARSVARAAGVSEREPEAQELARGNAEEQAPRTRPGDALLWGRLIDHGRATFHHDPHAPMSYFARLETKRGERTVWGVDIERAFKQSLTRPEIGEEVGLRAIRKDLVTVKAPKRDADGRVVGEETLQTHRNRWIVEKREFFEARSAAADTVRDSTIAAREAVRSHPELTGTYLYLKGAEEIARRQIRDPQDQRRFVEMVRGALADSVARGEPLAAMRLRERSPPRQAADRPHRSSEREPMTVHR